MVSPLFIRADASARMGTGHVMRCFALAQAWLRSAKSTVFLQAELTSSLVQRLTGKGIQVTQIKAAAGSQADAIETAALVRKYGGNWVVVDGYHFGSDYQRTLKAAGLHVLLVDDCGQSNPYTADVILNQNLHANESYYSDRESYVRLLLGPDYVQLRGEFQKWMQWQREIPKQGRKILITLGGSDPDNLTARVLQALPLLGKNELEITVVIGGSNLHYDTLLKLAEELPVPVLIERDSQRMDEWMAWADVAISSGGTTVWELAFMGVPSIIGQIGPAEEKLVSGLAQIDLFTRLSWFLDTTSEQIAAALQTLLSDEELRRQMSEKARRLVDGKGTERVMSVLADDLLPTGKRS